MFYHVYVCGRDNSPNISKHTHARNIRTLGDSAYFGISKQNDFSGEFTTLSLYFFLKKSCIENCAVIDYFGECFQRKSAVSPAVKKTFHFNGKTARPFTKKNQHFHFCINCLPFSDKYNGTANLSFLPAFVIHF